MSFVAFIWAVLGLILMAAELFTPGFWVIFLGAGGLVTAAASWLVPGVAGHILAQVLIWLGSSALLLGLLRRSLRPLLERRNPPEDAIGEQAEVVEAIAPGKPGRIRFRGTTWRAECWDETLAPGDKVQILERQDLTYFVGRPFLEDTTT